MSELQEVSDGCSPIRPLYCSPAGVFCGGSVTAREREQVRAARDKATRARLNAAMDTAAKARRRRLRAATVTDGTIHRSSHVRSVLRMLERDGERL